METILDRIHRSSIELLASIGVRFHCPETLERLEARFRPILNSWPHSVRHSSISFGVVSTHIR